MATQAVSSKLPQLLRPLPPFIAQTRLKFNVLALIFALFVRYVFTPYWTIRRSLIWYADEYVQHRVGGQMSRADQAFWLLETGVVAILLWNILEASVSLKYPTKAAQPPRPAGIAMTPSSVSSPLTRPYSPSAAGTPVRSAALPATPLSGVQSTNAMQRFSTPMASSSSTSTPSRMHHTAAVRASPLSQSTAKIFNLSAQLGDSDGLFFDPDANASPSKVGARTGGGDAQLQGNQAGVSQQQQQQGTGSASSGKQEADGFVLVEKNEREYVENIWTGVRARGGRSDL